MRIRNSDFSPQRKYLISNAAFSTCMGILVSVASVASAQPTTVSPITFHIDLRRAVEAGRFDPEKETVGVRGDRGPLSWERTLAAQDNDGDYIYELKIGFRNDSGASQSLGYKFKVDGDANPEDGWETGPNRLIALNDQDQQVRRAFNEPPNQPSTTLVTAEGLQKDIAILKDALVQLHPGLYRYNDETSIAEAFGQLEAALKEDTPLAKAYLVLSEFLAKIKCGHTYANFLNQPDVVKQEVFYGPNKLPLAFKIVEKRLIVTHNASDKEQLKPGTEILTINGVSVSIILDRLKALVKADGGNDGKRIHDLQITGFGEFEAFDVYFPLLFPVLDGQFKLEAVDLTTNKQFELTVSAVTRAQRTQKLSGHDGAQPASLDELWEFKMLDAKTAYLQLGTFATWKMKLKWKEFLRQAFARIKREKIPNLILDIRGNEGGADEVNNELSKYLISKPVELAARHERLRYKRVPKDLDQYLKTWDPTFRNRGMRVVETGDGFYTWRNASSSGRKLRPRGQAFDGQIYLLVDAANSSATFYLASVLKDHQLATLIGQETGGNRRGTNGGQLFFLHLPNSRLEVDIPLIGYFPEGEQPDRGVLPDIKVKPSVENLISNIDAELETAKRLIRK